jgi:NAD-dependent dihydropyrimidine dehydrogenase PreA subunit
MSGRNTDCFDQTESCDAVKGERFTMKVWIDQDLCPGDGLCEEIALTVFTDGLA